ncbi:hypothetical protein BC827DRAFT_132419 [Russula dissimulans]|nr:hypothetical protein BC827DRAFT_132419 [Russula dissimulans]
MKLTTFVAFSTDLLLVFIMLVGLFQRRYHRRDYQRDTNMVGLGHFMWDQGILFLLVTTVAGILPTVFICMNLNEPLSIIFHIPWVIAMSIAATRMYRALEKRLASEIASENSEPSNSRGTSHESDPTISISGTWGTIGGTNPLTANEMIGVSGPSADEKPHDVSHVA